jgi:hypothetical protein
VLGLFVVEGFNIPGLELLELKHVDVPWVGLFVDTSWLGLFRCFLIRSFCRCFLIGLL